MVFGLFSKEKALQRVIERAINKLAQQPDRWGALEALRKDGSEEAIYGLCKRFSIVSMKASEDEAEKAWTEETLVAMGPTAFAPIRRYLKQHAQLSYALKVLGQIVPRDKVLEVVDELFDDEPPGYTRDPERKLDLLRFLHEWSGGAHDDMAPRLIPYLKDHAEDVRYAAADGLSRLPGELFGDALIAALTNPEEEAGRFKRRLCEILIEKKVPLGAAADRVKAALTGPALQGFAVKNGQLVAK
jgi:HEAT repeat protein